MTTRPGGMAMMCGLLLASGPAAALAADAVRGARLYLQLPADVPSCASCHGADPAGNRNNILRAGDQPQVLLKALGAVSAMGYLKPVLSDADLADLAAYLGAVTLARGRSDQAFWPRTVDFGTLVPGAASPLVPVRWRNLSSHPVSAPVVQLVDGRFEIAHDCRGLVAPGADCQVSLRALAARPGDLVDALRFGVEPVAVVGVAARVRAEPLPVWVADVPSGVVDFGRLAAGERATRTVTLRNAGTAAGAVGAATLTGPGSHAFEWADGCALAGELVPGQACTLSLEFRPGTDGASTALLQWRGDGTQPQTLELRGQGVAAPVEVPPTPPPAGGTGGGGCAAGPPARTGDITLAALLLSAAAARYGRRRRGKQVR